MHRAGRPNRKERTVLERGGATADKAVTAGIQEQKTKRGSILTNNEETDQLETIHHTFTLEVVAAIGIQAMPKDEKKPSAEGGHGIAGVFANEGERVVVYAEDEMGARPDVGEMWPAYLRLVEPGGSGAALL